MQNRNCRIKLSHERASALRKLYKLALMQGEYLLAGELVYAHGEDMHQRLREMTVKEKTSYTLNLSVVECIALTMFWGTEPVPMDIWESEIVRKCTDAAQKHITYYKNTLKSKFYEIESRL